MADAGGALTSQRQERLPNSASHRLAPDRDQLVGSSATATATAAAAAAAAPTQSFTPFSLKSVNRNKLSGWRIRCAGGSVCLSVSQPKRPDFASLILRGQTVDNKWVCEVVSVNSNRTRDRPTRGKQRQYVMQDLRRSGHCTRYTQASVCPTPPFYPLYLSVADPIIQLFLKLAKSVRDTQWQKNLRKC